MTSIQIALFIGAIAVIAGVALYFRSPSRDLWIAPSRLNHGPIIHAKLDPGLVDRVRVFEVILADVFPQSHDRWIENFLRDKNPEAEVENFEHIATAYTQLPHDWSLDKRREAFGLLILRSATNASETIGHAQFQHLTLEESRKVVGLYTAAPQPITVTLNR